MNTVAAILAIGDELTSGLTLDTNSPWIARRLAERGVTVVECATVDDDQSRITAAIQRLTSTVELLIVTGGLGPTPDDLTREALGDVVAPGEDMELDEEALVDIEKWFARSGRAKMPALNRKQALRPSSAEIIHNAHGTAPALRVKHNGCMMYLLPGVPREMKHIFDERLDDIAPRTGDVVTITRSVLTCGIGESGMAERLGSLLDRARHPQIGTTSSRSIVAARIYATGPRAEIEPEVEEAIEQIESRLEPYVFGRDDATVASALGCVLRERSLLLATAESCTGGMVGAMLTELPGSSAFYRGGWVTYSNEMKAECIDVSWDALNSVGAVSEQVATEMAIGAIERSGANMSVSITGIAGPEGGSQSKPVGTVFIGCAKCNAETGENAVVVRQFQFKGDRERIRERAAKTALQMTRLFVIDRLSGTHLLGEGREMSVS